jgi:hypothetical protein
MLRFANVIESKRDGMNVIHAEISTATSVSRCCRICAIAPEGQDLQEVILSGR